MTSDKHDDDPELDISDAHLRHLPDMANTSVSGVDKAETFINQILEHTQPQLMGIFTEKFGEAMEGEEMLELVANVQLYTAACMSKAITGGMLL